MQEGKSAGLGAIAGAADTYWGKNKGRSMEGRLVTGTKILVVLFVVILCCIESGNFLRNAKDCREYDSLFAVCPAKLTTLAGVSPVTVIASEPCS